LWHYCVTLQHSLPVSETGHGQQVKPTWLLCLLWRTVLTADIYLHGTIISGHSYFSETKCVTFSKHHSLSLIFLFMTLLAHAVITCLHVA
jgi:hypothetical protein